jgi:hypothetical protein
MTITQTVEIPTSRRITLEVPPEIPVGETILTFTPASVSRETKGNINSEAFRSILHRAYGAWKDKPWVNHLEDVNTMRDEWEHRDPWKAESAKKHQD